MLRSTLAFAGLFATFASALACTRTSDNPPVVSAPMASSGGAATTSPDAAAGAAAAPKPSASALSTTAGAASTDVDAGAPIRFRACQADADCIAVPLVGCCHNGHMEAVSVTQKDAYAQSFVCPQPRPMCPMYIVRDTRVAKCDAAAHLCTMVDAKP